MKMNYENLVISLKENKTDYYLWEEGQWSKADYNFLTETKSEHFQRIMNWHTKERTIALFRIKQ
jgi:gas vesicle protein